MSRTVDAMSSSHGDPGGPTLKVAAVARRLGVAPATLRTWARRYGLGPSAHVAGSHRQYSSEDLARLVVMRRMTLEGVSPAEAARVAVNTEVSRPVTTPGSSRARHPGHDATGWGSGRHAVDERDGWDDQELPDHAGTGGSSSRRGAAAAQSDDDDSDRRFAGQSSALLEAARALDSLACAGHVGHLIAEYGAAGAWESVLAPTLARIGVHWSETGDWVDVEHVLSDAITAEFHRASPLVTGDARVLLACAEGEQHALPLHALAAALAERGVGTRVLGGQVPTRALLSAVTTVTPTAVVVLALLPTRNTDQLTALGSLVRPRTGTQLFAAGPGWGHHALPEGAVRLTTMRDALGRLERHLTSVR